MVVQLLSCVQLCDPMDCSTPGLPVLHYLQGLAKLMFIELMMQSDHLILCHLLLFPLSILPSSSFLSSFVSHLLDPPPSHSCSVAQLLLTICPTPMDYSMPGFPVLYHLPGFAQTHVHRVGDAVQPSHPLSSPFPAFNLSQHQGLF